MTKLIHKIKPKKTCGNVNDILFPPTFDDLNNVMLMRVLDYQMEFFTLKNACYDDI